MHEALLHGGFANNIAVNLEYVNSEEIDDAHVAEKLKGLDGILVPGGFGTRGVEGKITTIKYARENKIPFFGICLGMQCAVIEYARNVAKIADANSAEFETSTENPVIYLMAEWFDPRTSQKECRDTESEKGGTMRLGSYPCTLENDSLAHKAYGKNEIHERHRHRFEFNNKYSEILKENGLLLSGLSPAGDLVEIVEIKDHPWFLGCQFHPEFKSSPMKAHPLFKDFIAAALKNKK